MCMRACQKGGESRVGRLSPWHSTQKGGKSRLPAWQSAQQAAGEQTAGVAGAGGKRDQGAPLRRQAAGPGGPAALSFHEAGHACARTRGIRHRGAS